MGCCLGSSMMASKASSNSSGVRFSSLILDHLLHRRLPRNGPVYRLGVGVSVRASHGTTVYAALGSALARTRQHATQRSGSWPPRAGAPAPPPTCPCPPPRDTEGKHPTAHRSSHATLHPGVAPTAVLACAPLRSCRILRASEPAVQVAKVLLALVVGFVRADVAATAPTRLACGAEEHSLRPLVHELGTVFALQPNVLHAGTDLFPHVISFL